MTITVLEGSDPKHVAIAKRARGFLIEILLLDQRNNVRDLPKLVGDENP